MDFDEFEELSADLPGLARVGRFVRHLADVPWFANLGEELTPGAEAAARRFLDGLGFPYADVAVILEWADVAAAAENLDWNTPAWEAEESLRADVTARARDQLSEDALSFATTAVADIAAGSSKLAVAEAETMFETQDETIRELAVGAAVQAAHEALLAHIVLDDTEAEDHPFLAKFQLFEFGRWPIGIAGQSFNLF
ncbi:MAG: hypothetical protein AAF742_01345 [Pseudomonadota bacterium]